MKIKHSLSVRRSIAFYSLTIAALAGCTQKPAFFPNSDPALHKTAAEFAADAAHRHYESDAPKGGDANGRVEIDYGMHRISIVNASAQDWDDAEIWVDQKYVIAISKIPANAARVEMLDFQYIFDEHGTHVPFDSQDQPISTVEMFKDGKMYSLGQPRLAD